VGTPVSFSNKTYRNSIKTFDFSTLYTTIPHSKLKDRLRELVQLCFIKRNDQRRYNYLVLGKDRSYFVKKMPTDSTKKFSETDIINMLEFLIDSIFVIFGGRVFQQTVRFLKKNEKQLAQSYNFTFRYIHL
jgi:hypothetical protein